VRAFSLDRVHCRFYGEEVASRRELWLQGSGSKPGGGRKAVMSRPGKSWHRDESDRPVCQRVQSPGEVSASRAIIVATNLTAFFHSN